MFRIGIDIGRVIIGPVLGGIADTSFLGGTPERALRTPPAPGALEGVAGLVRRSGGQAWLVSKCGPNVQAKTRAWLDHQGFWERTQMPREHLVFCLRRPEKAEHARRLGLTAMIDDRLDVLSPMRGLVPSLLWFGEQDTAAPDWVTPVVDWAAVNEWAEAQTWGQALAG